MTKRVLESGKLPTRDRAIVLVKLRSFMDNGALASMFNFVAWPELCQWFGIQNFRLWDERKVPAKVDPVGHKTGYVHYWQNV